MDFQFIFKIFIVLVALICPDWMALDNVVQTCCRCHLDALYWLFLSDGERQERKWDIFYQKKHSHFLENWKCHLIEEIGLTSLSSQSSCREIFDKNNGIFKIAQFWSIPIESEFSASTNFWSSSFASSPPTQPTPHHRVNTLQLMWFITISLLSVSSSIVPIHVAAAAS